jgi:uncharacterized protein YjgD (DUF1641 family)
MATDSDSEYTFGPAEGGTDGDGDVDGDTDGAGELSDGRRALQEAIDEHGEQLASVLEQTDTVENLLETAILVIASADEEEVEHVTESLVNLVAAGDALTGDQAAELVEIIEQDGDHVVEALETVLELQRRDQLEDLIELASTLSALEVDDDAAAGLDRLVGAVGDAEREAEPTGPLGLVRGLLGKDAREGLGYLLALLRSLGR